MLLKDLNESISQLNEAYKFTARDFKTIEKLAHNFKIGVEYEFHLNDVESRDEMDVEEHEDYYEILEEETDKRFENKKDQIISDIEDDVNSNPENYLDLDQIREEAEEAVKERAENDDFDEDDEEYEGDFEYWWDDHKDNYAEDIDEEYDSMLSDAINNYDAEDYFNAVYYEHDMRLEIEEAVADDIRHDPDAYGIPSEDLEGKSGSDDAEAILIDEFYHNDRYAGYVEDVTTDPSVDDGAELISLPLSPEKTFDFMKDVFTYIQHNGYTSDDTGMHVNVSVDKTLVNKKRFNPLKLLLLLDDREVQRRLFDERSHSTNVQDMIKHTAHTVLNPNEYESLIDAYVWGELDTIEALLVPFAKKTMNKGKSINVDNIKDTIDSMIYGRDRIEFRYLGGDKYEYKFDEIKTEIYRIMYLFLLAHTDIEEELYRKHLIKFFEKNILERIISDDTDTAKFRQYAKANEDYFDVYRSVSSVAISKASLIMFVANLDDIDTSSHVVRDVIDAHERYIKYSGNRRVSRAEYIQKVVELERIISNSPTDRQMTIKAIKYIKGLSKDV